MHKWLDAALRRSGLTFSRTARRSFRYLAQYYPPFYSCGFLEKVVGFDSVLRELDAHDIPGDVVECGLGRGLSFFTLAHFMARRRGERRLFGFDSFAGFPPPSAFDASPRRPVAGDLWRDTSLRHVVDHFVTGGLEDFLRQRVTIVPGFFSESLPGRTEPSTIALLNVDVDLYDSYRQVLEELGPRVRGLIVYDEYGSPKWPGATRAVDEHLPALEHRLFYSRVMDRYVSLSAASVDSPFGMAATHSLELLDPAQSR
jgi:O-methyltransferase